MGLEKTSQSWESILIEKENLELIFSSVTDGIFTHDTDLRITSFNQAAERITGFSKEEVLGKRCTEVFGTNLCRDYCVLARTIETQSGAKDEEVRITGKDGRERILILNTVVLHDRQKIPCGAMVVFKDITELVSLKKELKERYRFHNLMGKNHKMQEIYELIEDIADSDVTVLIQGESGTGKELVAHAIHYQGIRANGPFVKVNCSALTETLLESELFGHVKGAFTGAIRDKIGRFELANKGTVFLDEIGDISPSIQAKLLRVLQDKQIERVGDTKPIKVDVRVVAATNKDLKKLVHQEKFREDLFYRLYVVPIHLSPLRERKEDIPLLVEHFIERFHQKSKKQIEGISQEALRLFMDYNWRGNVRELENAIEHAFVKCHGKIIGAENLPQEILEVGVSRRVATTKREEKNKNKASQPLLFGALEESGWNRTKASKMLGIGRTTLWRRLKEMGISNK